MTHNDRRSALHRKIDRLGDHETAVVERVVDACILPVTSDLTADSWLGGDWGSMFQTRIRAHHALNPDPLGTKPFEAAFNSACELMGWAVVPTSSATHRFFDTTVTIPGSDPLQLSLKSSAAKGLRPDTIHISKLTEAAWIQDARNQRDRRDQIVALFEEYRGVTDAIIMLRCFPVEAGARFRYELVEIPTSVFEPVGRLTVAEAQHGTIPIPADQHPPTLKVRIDRSDAKVTVTALRLDACVVHGRWTVANLSGVDDDILT